MLGPFYLFCFVNLIFYWSIVELQCCVNYCCIAKLLFFSPSVVSDSLQHHGLEHTRLPCPSLSPRVHSNSCPLSQWCYLTLCHPLLLLPSVFPSIRVFSDESAFLIRCPKYWSFSISPSNENSGFISLGWTGLISLLSRGLSRVFSSTTIQKYQFFGTQPSL